MLCFQRLITLKTITVKHCFLIAWSMYLLQRHITLIFWSFTAAIWLSFFSFFYCNFFFVFTVIQCNIVAYLYWRIKSKIIVIFDYVAQHENLLSAYEEIQNINTYIVSPYTIKILQFFCLAISSSSSTNPLFTGKLLMMM